MGMDALFILLQKAGYVMSKYLLILSMILMTAICAGQETEDMGAGGYEALEKRMLQNQRFSPDMALELAEKLMKEYPGKGAAYGVAATIHTMKGRIEQAENVLLDAIRNVRSNSEFHLRLAHFYQRDEALHNKLAEHLDRFRREETEREDYEIVFAKMLVVAGRKQEAADILKKAITEGRPETHAQALPLLNILRETADEDTVKSFLVSQISRSDLPFKTRQHLLMNHVKSLKNPTLQDYDFLARETVALSFGAGEYTDVFSFIREVLMALNQANHVQGFLQALDRLPSGSMNDAMTLFIKIRHMKEDQRLDDALKMIRDYSGGHPVVIEEKARTLDENGLTTDALQVWRQLAETRPRDDRILLSLGRQSNKLGLHAESLETLDHITSRSLAEGFLPLYYALYFDNLARLGSYQRLVNKWVELGRFSDFSRMRVAAGGILGSLPESDQHQALLIAIEDQIKFAHFDPPQILLLKAFTLEELRDFDSYFQTAEEYLKHLTSFDEEAFRFFAEKAMARAVSMPPSPKGIEPDLTITNEAWLDMAERWIQVLSDKAPQIPDYHQNLLMIHRVRKREDSARRMIQNLEKGHERNADRLNIIALILARTGSAEEALPYYDRALAIKPMDVNIRLNRAGCLTRLGRFEEALDVYREVLSGKHSAKAYDPDDILSWAWGCHDLMGKKEQYADYIRGLKDNTLLSPNELFLTAASVLSSRGEFVQSAQLAADFIREYPDSAHVYDAYARIGECLAMQEKFEEAIGIYKKCRERAGDDKTRIVDAEYNIGEMRYRQGRKEEAISLWRELARQHPGDSGAHNALFRAGVIAEEELKKPDMAVEMYQSLKSLPGIDSNVQKAAEERIRDIKQSESR